ncbi:MAG: C40 family peptidase [Endomicrobium sp.]|jgi:cell wall-associated NlpC family hydrolase|nr:C40 family peptidase [Endomicrobium sp.]
MKNYTKYLFYKYKDNARGEDGFIDCYGLFLLIQKEIFGKDLPDFNGYDCGVKQNLNKNLSKSLINYPAKRIYAAIEGCGVVMESGGVDSHIGIYIGNNKIIHCSHKRNVIIEDIMEPHLKGRLKFYEILSI